jgi:hypothetical protein
LSPDKDCLNAGKVNDYRNPGSGGVAVGVAAKRETNSPAPDLTALIDAWPTLAEPVKAGIVAIVPGGV